MFPRELWVEMMGWTASKLIIEVVLIVFYCDTDAVVLGLGSGLDEIIIIKNEERILTFVIDFFYRVL